MAKHKILTHLPTPPAPRLAAQLFAAFGEFLAVGACIVGVITVAGWIIAAAELRNLEHIPRRGERPHLQPTTWVCWFDRRYGEMCEPVNRLPPVRRHYARDVY